MSCFLYLFSGGVALGSDFSAVSEWALDNPHNDQDILDDFTHFVNLVSFLLFRDFQNPSSFGEFLEFLGIVQQL